MVGPKKQAFCPKINMLKGNFDTNYFEPLFERNHFPHLFIGQSNLALYAYMIARPSKNLENYLLSLAIIIKRPSRGHS